MLEIPTDKYLAHALDFSPEEQRFRDEFAEWLPDNLIDCHAHCNLPEHVLGMTDRARKHMFSTFPGHSLDDSERIKKLFYPWKVVRSLRFANVFRGIDHRSANQYLLEESPTKDRIAVFGLPEDIEYTVGLLRHPRCSALKMYYSYLEPPAEKIYDIFRPEILEEAQTLDIPLVLHLPKMIIFSLPDLLQMFRDFPRLRAVIAHLGSSKLVQPELFNAFEIVAKIGNISLDTSLNTSAEVVHMALSSFGSHRILFGSDEPLSLIRSAVFIHPEKGQRLATSYPYHWVDETERAQFGHLASASVHAHWQSLQAIRNAINQFPEETRKGMKKRVFHDNAQSFFKF